MTDVALPIDRKDSIEAMLFLVPRRLGRYSICDTFHKAEQCFS